MFMEILVALVLMAIAIIPMLDAFAPSFLSSNVQQESAVFSNQVRWTLFRVSALDFATLDSNRGDPVDLVQLFDNKPAEAAKENFTYRGATYTPRVAILDASGGVGGLLEVRVTVDRVTLAVLKADY
jgi:hypothetical protein